MGDQPEGLDMRRRDRFSALMLANYAAKVYMGHGHTTPNAPGTASTRKRSITKRRFNMRGNTMW
jgi:hypothetical protein